MILNTPIQFGDSLEWYPPTCTTRITAAAAHAAHAAAHAAMKLCLYCEHYFQYNQEATQGAVTTAESMFQHQYEMEIQKIISARANDSGIDRNRPTDVSHGERRSVVSENEKASGADPWHA